MGLAPVNAMEGWPPRTQKVTVLGMAQAPQDVPPGSGPVPLYRRLLPMPSSLGVGLECHAWRSLGSQTCTPYSRMGQAGSLNLTGSRQEDPGLGL